jgi:signal peptidase I
MSAKKSNRSGAPAEQPKSFPIGLKVVLAAVGAVIAGGFVWLLSTKALFVVLAAGGGAASVWGYMAGGSPREHVVGVGQVLVFFLLFTWLGFQQFNIPSGSMEPTLHGDPSYWKGDRVWVNKWWYGTRVPFTKQRFFKWHEPQRGDIVVFKAVEENASHGTLIKRVAGLPGERIQIRDGKIHVNGEAAEVPESMRGIEYTSELDIKIPDEMVWEYMAPSDRRAAAQNPEFRMEKEAQVRQWLRGKVTSREPLRYGVLDDDAYTVVPEGHYLLLGDNSGHSRDGRVWGWVPNGNIIGRATCIWWPFGRRCDLTGWTHTWWGRVCLFGIPALFVLHSLYTHTRKGKKGKEKAA